MHATDSRQAEHTGGKRRRVFFQHQTSEANERHNIVMRSKNQVMADAHTAWETEYNNSKDSNSDDLHVKPNATLVARSQNQNTDKKEHKHFCQWAKGLETKPYEISFLACKASHLQHIADDEHSVEQAILQCGEKWAGDAAVGSSTPSYVGIRQAAYSRAIESWATDTRMGVEDMRRPDKAPPQNAHL